MNKSLYSDYSKKLLRKIKKRLENELRMADLPKHRRTEIESSLYYLNEELRHRKRKVS